LPALLSAVEIGVKVPETAFTAYNVLSLVDTAVATGEEPPVT
jgi:hypothetical protein